MDHTYLVIVLAQKIILRYHINYVILRKMGGLFSRQQAYISIEYIMVYYYRKANGFNIKIFCLKKGTSFLLFH